MSHKNPIQKLFAIAVVLMAGFGGVQSARGDTVQSFFEIFNNAEGTSVAQRLFIGEDPLTEGDVIRGIFLISQLNADGPNLGGLTPNNEWTGLFEIEVTGKRETGGTTAAGQPEFQFTFGPHAGFAEANALTGANNPNNIMVIMWEDEANNFTRKSGNILTDEASATDGDLFWTLGFLNPEQASRFEDDGEGGTTLVSDNGEGWVGNGGDMFTALAGQSPSNEFGFSNFGVNRVTSLGKAGDISLIPQALGFGAAAQLGADPEDTVEFLGSSKIKGASGVASAGWHGTGETSFTFLIPTPTAAFGGIALLGLLAARRPRSRRNRA